MKIAIASSGLGHVARGIETWALDTAVALAEVRREALDVRREMLNVRRSDSDDVIEVTLFAAAPLPHLHVRRSLGEGGAPHASRLTIRVLPCLKRGDRLARFLARISPGFTWRWGFKDTYGWEQFSFWLRLWPHLRRGEFDILHVQDPLVAYWCRLFRSWGLVKTKEILAHGTEEPVEFLEKFDFLQELTPIYAARHTRPQPGQIIGVAPNFVDTTVFLPAGERKKECRQKLGIPPDAVVVLSVGSLNRSRKRMDYLVSEFARWGRKDSFLVLAGACDSAESQVLVAEAKAILGERLIVLVDLARERMPDIYAVADVFVLCATRELFGIAFLEAMACGIPCLGHQYPVTEWVLGVESLFVNGYPLFVNSPNNQSQITNNPAAGGGALDMSKEGALAESLAGLTPEWIAEHGRQARERAVKMFSTEAVIGQYVKYYEEVVGKSFMSWAAAGG